MTCTLALGPGDTFELITPSGRRVYIPISPHGIKEMWQVLWNATAEKAARPGGPFLAKEARALAQAEWDRVEAENAAWNELKAAEALAAKERRLEARQAKASTKVVASKYGVDLKQVSFSI